MFKSKKLILTLVCGALVLTACGKNDKEYYINNPEQAKEKLNSCETDMQKAMFSGDEKKMRSLVEDEECNAAQDALNEIKRVKREQERKEAEAKQAAEEAQKAKLIADAKISLEKEYKALTWQQKVTRYANSDCVSNASYTTRNLPECIAAKEYNEEQEKIGTEELSKLALPELEALTQEYCSIDRRNISPCAVLSEVYHTKSEQAVTDYLNDLDSLKRDYNSCVDKVDEVRQSKETYSNKSILKDNIVSFYPCKQAKDARSKLNLGYDGNPPINNRS